MKSFSSLRERLLPISENNNNGGEEIGTKKKGKQGKKAVYKKGEERFGQICGTSGGKRKNVAENTSRLNEEREDADEGEALTLITKKTTYLTLRERSLGIRRKCSHSGGGERVWKGSAENAAGGGFEETTVQKSQTRSAVLGKRRKRTFGDRSL